MTYRLERPKAQSDLLPLKYFLFFIFGFLLAATVSTVVFLRIQNTEQEMPASSLVYVTKAAGWIDTLDTFYNPKDGFAQQGGTSDDIAKEREKLTDLVKDIDSQKLTLELMGLNHQLRFAALRCESLAERLESASDLSSYTDDNFATMITVIVNERTSCLSEINNARLRLIDYAVPYAVNPFD